MEFFSIIWGAVFGCIVYFVLKSIFFPHTKPIRSTLEITTKDIKGHYVCYDEPLVCPIDGREFYRWQWTEAEERDTNFRKNYYTHILSGGVYRLPCPTCAKDKHDYILETNRLEYNKEVARWNKLSMKEREKEALSWYGTTAPDSLGPDLRDRKPWGPEDEE